MLILEPKGVSPIAKKKRREKSNSKLAFQFIYHISEDGEKYLKPKTTAPDKKTWESITGHDISKLFLNKWSIDRIAQHFHVSGKAILEKIRWSWTLAHTPSKRPRRRL
jgi:hypothetical protein